jgi:Uma2 family endonuclease
MAQDYHREAAGFACRLANAVNVTVSADALAVAWGYSRNMAHSADDFPRPHRLTVADYRRMADVGILDGEARVELIDGEIIDMPPPGSMHAATVHRLMEIFTRAAGDTASVLVQNPVVLGEHSEPQPDLALLRRREDFYSEGHPRPADILLLVEVAASSLRFDRDKKTPLYAAHGIVELWLVDLGARRLVRHRAAQQGAYSLVDQPDLGIPLGVAALPGVAFDLTRLFG